MASPLATVSYPVSFTVVNHDESSLASGVLPTVQIPTTLGGIALPGAGSNLLVPQVNGDGKTYTVQGHITAPAGALKASNPAATLYVHGLGYGEWFWRFTQVAGYNYAQTAAQAGLTSVTIDKLGYGASSVLNGNNLGYGTEATIDHQIMDELKSGGYTLNGKPGVKFSKLALAGATQAAFSAELENQKFHDAQGLILAGFADEGFSAGLVENYITNVMACQTAKVPDTKDNQPGYQYREVGDAQFNKDDLVDTAPAVIAAADGLHTNDPCGYPAYSVAQTLVQNNLLDPADTILQPGASGTPVLSVIGTDDSEFYPPADVAITAPAYQKVEFAADKDVTIDADPGVGQDLVLGTKHAAVDAQFTTWLCQRNFGAGTNGSCTVGLTSAASSAPVGRSTAGSSVGGTEAAVSSSPASAGSGAALAATGRDLPREIEVSFTLLLSGIVLVAAAGLMISDERRRQTGR